MADDETQLECQDTQIEGNIKKIIEDNGFVEDPRVAAAEARSNEAEARANEAEARANEAEARTKKIFTRAKEVEEGFHAKCKDLLGDRRQFAETFSEAFDNHFHGGEKERTTLTKTQQYLIFEYVAKHFPGIASDDWMVKLATKPERKKGPRMCKCCNVHNNRQVPGLRSSYLGVAYNISRRRDMLVSVDAHLMARTRRRDD